VQVDCKIYGGKHQQYGVSTTEHSADMHFNSLLGTQTWFSAHKQAFGFRHLAKENARVMNGQGMGGGAIAPGESWYVSPLFYLPLPRIRVPLRPTAVGCEEFAHHLTMHSVISTRHFSNNTAGRYIQEYIVRGRPIGCCD